MFETQKYLLNIGGEDALKSLKQNYAIDYKFNQTGDLVILDYSQIDSPKKHIYVRECRGLILEFPSFKVVSCAFLRFFNLDEYPEDFNWDGDITCSAKHDGSLIKIKRHNGELLITTRFSFGEGEVNKSGFTWRDLVLAHIDPATIEPHVTYVCELCGPYNRVVRDYPPTLYLLSAFYHEINDDVVEVSYSDLVKESNDTRIPITEHYQVSSKEDVVSLLERLGKEHPDFEGVVINNGEQRVKVKREQYLLLHRMISNHQITDADLLDMAFTGESSEFLSYFKDYIPRYESIIDKFEKLKIEIQNTYDKYKEIINQKDFAIKAMKYKYYFALFELRKGKSIQEILSNSEKIVNLF